MADRMLERLVEAIRLLDDPPTARELADALWLAQQLAPYDGGEPQADHSEHRPDSQVPVQGQSEPPLPSESMARTRAPSEQGTRTGGGQSAQQDVGFYMAEKGTPPALAVRSPGVPAIPHELRLMRAMRAFRVAAPSKTREDLDEMRTAEHAAHTGIWYPVMRPIPERKLDLALVVDTSSSMAVWQRAAQELRTLLERLGAFRDIRVWRLDTDGDGLRLHGESTASGTAGRSLEELIDPAGRRVVLVLSDCIGGAWQDGRAAAGLERLGRAGPVAVVQPLPQWLWHRCAAAVAPVRLGASLPGTPNARLAVERRSGAERKGIAVPVVELEERWLRPWAAMVARGGGSIQGAAIFTGDPVADGTPPEDIACTPEDRVMRFRAASSPPALRLARFLAAAPLRLPVMRLVQEAMLPESGPAHLAEVFLGDLLHKVWNGPDEYGDVYEFHDGVRDVLLSGLRRGEAYAVLREVWNVVRERYGSPLDFPAMVRAIGEDAGALPPDEPFARVTARVLARLGGRYGEVSRTLAVAPEPRSAERAATVWNGVPPRDPGFTGRGGVLDALEAASGRGVTVLCGPAASGKSAVAAEHAHRCRDRYDLVLWIPAGDPQTVRSALTALGDRLGTPLDEGPAGVLAGLASGVPYKRRLLVFDDAADPRELLPLLPRNGSVVVTTRDRRWEDHAPAIEVGPFARDESLALLRSRLPGRAVGDADRLARRIGDWPMALVQAAAWLSATGHGVDDYLREHDRRAAKLAGGPAASFPRPVAAGVDLNLVRVERAHPAAGALLDLWAWLGPEPVTAALLAPGLAATPDEVLDELRNIDRYGLGALEPETAGLRVHRLVRTLLRARLGEAGRLDGARERAHAILAAAVPAAPPEDETTWGRRAEIARHTGPAGIIAGRHRKVVVDQARYLLARGDVDGARRLAEQAIPRWRDRYGDDDEHVFGASRVLADALRALGETRAAARLSRDCFARMREVFGLDHHGTLLATLGVAAALRDEGDFRRSYELDRDLWSRLGGDHAEALLAAEGVGTDLRLLGAFHEAYEVDRARTEQLSERPRARSRATHQVALDLHGLGRYEEALELQRSILDLATAFHHAQLAHAATLRASGQYAAAKQLAAQAYQAHKRRFGEEHPNTHGARLCLAIAVGCTGAVRQSRDLTLESLAGYRRALGEGHPFTLACIHHLGIALRALGDVQTALEHDHMVYEALEQNPLGPDHCYALCSRASQVNDLYLLGELEAALTVSDQVREKFHNHYGPSHPYTLACAHNHQVVAQALGLPTESTLPSLREALGDQHPEVLAAARGELLSCRIEATLL